jgi:uncharacterized small protein (DUF1192 family)
LDKRIELILKEIESLKAEKEGALSATRWGDRKVAGK